MFMDLCFREFHLLQISSITISQHLNDMKTIKNVIMCDYCITNALKVSENHQNFIHSYCNFPHQNDQHNRMLRYRLAMCQCTFYLNSI